MVKPIINKITPFDAGYDYTVSMTYSGNMSYKNRIIIYDAETLDVVFDETTTTYALKHIIPASTLTNGMKYAIQAQCFDSSGAASALSDKYYFWVLSTPSYSFSGINNGDTIEAATFTAIVNYSQSDGELLSTYQFYIYDSKKELLLQSSVLYDTENISYTYKGLSNSTAYFIRSIGVTERGINVDTGYIEIFIKYQNPETYTQIYAECDEETGIVRYYTNFKIIEPSEDKDYSYNDGFINLKNDTLTYDQQFEITDDFTLKAILKNFKTNKVLINHSNDAYNFSLSALDYDGKIVFKLTVPNAITNYILYSPALSITTASTVTVAIRRVNNVYQLKVW